MKAARTTFSEINRKFPAMPFTLRAIEGRGSRLGLVECLNHGLLHAYPVLHEKPGELVAQAKATVLLMPNGSDRITSVPAQSLDSNKQVLLPSNMSVSQGYVWPLEEVARGTRPGRGASHGCTT